MDDFLFLPVKSPYNTWQNVRKSKGYEHVAMQLSPRFTTVCIRNCPQYVHNFLNVPSSPCSHRQALGPTWKREYPSVLRIPPCSLPGMASFVNPSKPNFRVTSLKDPTPLISYHIDSWTPACGQNSHTPPSSSHAHEVRASVIRKTSDVTSSWPLTSDEEARGKNSRFRRTCGLRRSLKHLCGFSVLLVFPFDRLTLSWMYRSAKRWAFDRQRGGQVYNLQTTSTWVGTGGPYRHPPCATSGTFMCSLSSFTRLFSSERFSAFLRVRLTKD